MPLLARAATMDDLPDLLTFEQGVIAAERPYDETLRPDPISYYDLAELIAAPHAHVAVAETDGTLIGSGHVRKAASRPYTAPSHHAFVGFLYVVPEHRGRGVNQRVLNHLFDWARSNGLSEVRLTVYPDNEPAVRAYRKAGLTPHILEMRLNLEA